MMMMRISMTVALLSFVFLGAGCDIYGPGGTIVANDATMFTAALTGAAERPDAVDTDANGSGTFSLNAAETELSYNISASGLSDDVTAAHFHFSADGAAGFGNPVFTITDAVVNVADAEDAQSAIGVRQHARVHVLDVYAGVGHDARHFTE